MTIPTRQMARFEAARMPNGWTVADLVSETFIVHARPWDKAEADAVTSALDAAPGYAVLFRWAEGEAGHSVRASSQERNLSLPLADNRDATLWAGIEAAHGDQSVWPALTDALSDAGRRLLWEALHQAVESTPGDPEPALKVVEAFHRTMRIRRGPHYARRVFSRLGAGTR